MGIWNTSRGRDRRWRKSGSAIMPMPRYAQAVVVILAIAVVVSAGRGIANRLRPGSPKYTPSNAAGAGAKGTEATTWQATVSDSLDASFSDAQAGNITAAEVDADRAANLLLSARMQDKVSAPPSFFDAAIGQLERIILAKPDNDRLAEHCRLAEVALAELRSSLNTSFRFPTGPPLPRSLTSRSPQLRETIVTARGPRAIGINFLLDPASLGGNYLDATSMPFSAEILEPPSTRAFADNIRVENLTFSGAAQTLDGIHWRNAVFISTRLRYEGGPLSLQNVEFAHCTFGFTTDTRGGRLAQAIALGQTSLTIE